MNKIYRVIWNSALNCFIVTSELATGKSKSSSTQITKPSLLRGALITAVSLSALSSFSTTAVNDQLLVDGTVESREGYDITTSATNQPAIIIRNGGDLTYSNGQSSTSGTSANNVLVQTGSKLDMSGATLSTSAISTYGIVLSGASSANVRNTTITQTGATGAVGIDVTGNSEFSGSDISIISPFTGLNSNNSRVDITGLEINTSTTGAMGISGSGGSITIDNGRINTLGTSAYGIALSNVADSDLRNTEITTTGNSAWGLSLASGASADLSDSTLLTSGSTAHGIVLAGNSSANVSDTEITTAGTSAHGMVITGGSVAHLINTDITSSAAMGAMGITASGNSRLTGDDIFINSPANGLQTENSTVNVTNLNITTRNDNAVGISVTGGNVTVDGGSINTLGVGASAVSLQNWGLMKLSNMDITTLSPSAIAIKLGGTNLDADNLTINSAGQAIRLGTGSFNGDNLLINQSGSDAAVYGNFATVLSLKNSEIALLNEGSTGIFSYSDNLQLDNVLINGHSAGKGLHVQASLFNAKNLDIRMIDLNTPDDSAAMAVGTSSMLPFILEDSSIVATGSESRAVTLDNFRGSGLQIKNTVISAENTAIQTSENTFMALNLSGSSVTAPTLLSAGGTSASANPTRYIHLNAADASSLSGDVFVNRIGMQDSRISLDGSSVWSGAATDLHMLSLSDSSQWTMTGNSNIGEVNLAESNIIFSHDDGNFKTLTVEGDFNGTNGTLVINSVLADDASEHDTLLVNGNTSGETNVIVNNAGGSGAQTLQGIEVITVAGDSDGNFVQQGRIVAGAYDYRLTRGAGGAEKNWYLMSSIVPVGPIGPVDPITPVDPAEPVDPEIPGESEGGAVGPVVPVKPAEMVFRPEIGSYLANMAAANTLFNMRLHDRGGETIYVDALTGEEKVTSLWMRNLGGHTTFTDSSGQLKTKTNRYVLQLGGDIGKWTFGGEDSLHIGSMAGYGHAKSQTESKVSGLRSTGQVNGYSLGMYGTWYQNASAETGVYLDSWAQYNWFNNTVSGDGLSSEKYKSSGFTASLESGYTWKIGEKNARESYYLQPKAQVSWMGVKSDDFHEANGTRVSSTGDGNVQTRLGVRAFIKGHNKIDDGKQRSFEPYIEANWIANTQNFGSSLNGVNVSQRGTKNIGELKVGVDGQISPNLNLWGNFGQQMGDKGYSDSSAMLGVKVSF